MVPGVSITWYIYFIMFEIIFRRDCDRGPTFLQHCCSTLKVGLFSQNSTALFAVVTRKRPLFREKCAECTV